jgi:hypothetical protein
MIKLRILVANEPRSYREAIAGALQSLRPDAEVLTVDSEELGGEIGRGPSGMVLCSCVTSVVVNGSLAWVELYPGGGPGSRIGVGGLLLTAAGDLGLEDLLWIADRAESLAREDGTDSANGQSAAGTSAPTPGAAASRTCRAVAAGWPTTARPRPAGRPPTGA